MIALALISKGTGKDPERLRIALGSAAPYVDEIFVTLTASPNQTGEAEKVLKEFKAHVSYVDANWVADKKAVKWLKEFFGYEPYTKVGDKIFQFDVARNFNFSQVPQEHEWIIWLDTDDYLVGGQNLAKLMETGKEQDIEAFYFNYLYQAEFDEKGQVKHRIIEHLRERLVRNNGVYKWIAPVHETLIEQRPTRKMDVNACEVIHTATNEDRMESLERNLKNLELSIYQSKGKDPRHIYYLAKALFDIRTEEANERCIPLIMQYLLGDHKSGWPEERQQAWEYLGEIYRRKGQHNNSMKALINAFTEISEPTPSVFINIALTCVIQQRWELALFWIKIATQIPEKKTTLVKNTKDIQGRTLEVIYNACMNLAKVDEAWAAASKLLDMFPEEQNVKDAFAFINRIRAERDITMKISELADFLKNTGESAKIKPLLNAVPQLAAQNPFITELYLKNNPPKFWGDNEIAIWCGPGFTNWSPKQLDNPQGSFIGGSEEAVINMARELGKTWKVTVYGDPGLDEGEIDGVKWLPYYKFNKLDHFNILISWRQLGFFDQELISKKNYLWLHDIANNLEYTPDRIKKIDKIFVLSQWHRENINGVPDEKVFITSNGI